MSDVGNKSCCHVGNGGKWIEFRSIRLGVLRVERQTAEAALVGILTAQMLFLPPPHHAANHWKMSSSEYLVRNKAG